MGGNGVARGLEQGPRSRGSFLSDTGLRRAGNGFPYCENSTRQALAIQALNNAFNFWSALELHKAETSGVSRDTVANNLDRIDIEALLFKPGLKVGVIAGVRNITNKQSRH
jgi:hypothetical protein